jgi:F-type H+-transporting ATPase subunit b
MRKSPAKRLTMWVATFAAAVLILVQAPAALAAGDWRPTYDTVMMWINFVILATLLTKLLRHPLGNYLNSKRDAVKNTLDGLETEKNRIEEEIQSLRRMLEDRQQKAADLHQRIVEAGENERRDIIATARREAERRLLKARQLIDAHHREACLTLRNELIDSAVGKAMEELPKHMTPETEHALMDRFLKSISRPKG